MTLIGIVQILVFFAVIVAITKPIGTYMFKVFEGQRTFLHPILSPMERLIYRLGGVHEHEEQTWVRYSASLISLSIFSFLFVYLIQRFQGHLPLNPMHFSTPQAPTGATLMTPDLAFNTAVSFTTNTNWQSYSPDTTMSYLTQMAALAVQNFVSAAVGIAIAVALIRGFARHTAKMQHNVLAMSGKAVEASGDVNTLLLDKTGTITLGNRQAVEFIPVDTVSASELADAAQLSSLADETPEGRSIVILAKEKYGLRGREMAEHEAHFIPFSAYTRMSGVDMDGRHLRKGATEAIAQFVSKAGGNVPKALSEISDGISRNGGTPLAVADGKKVLGVIHLKDIVSNC